MLDPSTLSCKGVFTRICVLYYLGTILAVSYLNVRLLEFLGCYIFNDNCVSISSTPICGLQIKGRIGNLANYNHQFLEVDKSMGQASLEF